MAGRKKNLKLLEVRHTAMLQAQEAVRAETGAPFPLSTRELMSVFGVNSTNTVSYILTDLIAMGWVVQKEYCSHVYAVPREEQ